MVDPFIDPAEKENLRKSLLMELKGHGRLVSEIFDASKEECRQNALTQLKGRRDLIDDLIAAEDHQAFKDQLKEEINLILHEKNIYTADKESIRQACIKEMRVQSNRRFLTAFAVAAVMILAFTIIFRSEDKTSVNPSEIITEIPDTNPVVNPVPYLPDSDKAVVTYEDDHIPQVEFIDKKFEVEELTVKSTVEEISKEQLDEYMKGQKLFEKPKNP